MPTISSFRSKPSLTPVTMLATSDRVSPWSARTLRWSELRAHVSTLPSATVTEQAGRDRLAQLALGPLGLDGAASWTPTFTPWGTAMGFLPIRDIGCQRVRSRYQT